MTVRNAEQTAQSAEQQTTNDPGMCLQWSRQRANIAALFPDAATAWRNAFNRRAGDRNPPRGAMVYWLGGSKGYGHIAVALGNGKVRSTDAGGAGKVATRDLGWFEANWGLPYAGWADNVNDVAIPGVGGGGKDDDDMPYRDWPKADKDALTKDVADAVWTRQMEPVENSQGKKVDKKAGQLLRETWERAAKILAG